MKDRVATTRIYRNWVVPGLNDPDSVLLGAGMSVLGGLASSRLDNILVRNEQLAVHVTAGVQDFAQLGMVEVTADVKPGVDADMVAKRLDAIIRSEEHTSELQSLMRISYAVFCLKKKTK